MKIIVPHELTDSDRELEQQISITKQEISSLAKNVSQSFKRQGIKNMRDADGVHSFRKALDKLAGLRRKMSPAHRAHVERKKGLRDE